MTKTGQPCGATARPSGYCTEHDGGSNADLGQRGFGRSERTRIAKVEWMQRLIAGTTDGMTLAEIRLGTVALTDPARVGSGNKLRRPTFECVQTNQCKSPRLRALDVDI
jgi:hypothetical protein